MRVLKGKQPTARWANNGKDTRVTRTQDRHTRSQYWNLPTNASQACWRQYRCLQQRLRVLELISRASQPGAAFAQSTSREVKHGQASRQSAKYKGALEGSPDLGVRYDALRNEGRGLGPKQRGPMTWASYSARLPCLQDNALGYESKGFVGHYGKRSPHKLATYFLFFNFRINRFLCPLTLYSYGANLPGDVVRFAI